MELQNSHSSDEDLQSYSYPLRDGEAPLPVESMYHEYGLLLAKFITTYRDQITLPTNELFDPDDECYENLIFLLSKLKDIPVLDIIDHDSTMIDLIRWLKARNFGGSWFDSLESLLVDNVKNNFDHKLKLMGQWTNLSNDISRMSTQLEWFRSDLSSEEVEILTHRVKSLKSDLADVVEKKKAVSLARKSLKFCYLV